MLVVWPSSYQILTSSDPCASFAYLCIYYAFTRIIIYVKIKVVYIESPAGVGGKQHLWDHWNPYYGCGALDREKSGTSRQHKGDLPRFGPQRCVKPYDPALVDVFSVLELLN